MKLEMILVVAAIFFLSIGNSYIIAEEDFENSTDYVLSDAFLNYVNSKAKNWTAGRNFHADTPISYIKRMLGLHHEHVHLQHLPRGNPRLIQEIAGLRLDYFDNWLDIMMFPIQFDAREKWPNCSSLFEILDQGGCGSCWAIGAASAMSDRICISSPENKDDFMVSSENLLACCNNCGYGCRGGFPGAAWLYWHNVGIVTGGSYGSSQGCQPYEFTPCDHNIFGNCSEIVQRPRCHYYCDNSQYNKTYKEDLSFGSEPYLVGNLYPMKEIMHEIMNFGPVEATFKVYADFALYKRGVYHHVSGPHMGSHAVKILGWGTENGTPYWLAANSWNPSWGDNGFFKILRGSNHCDIEKYVYAGLPKMPKKVRPFPSGGKWSLPFYVPLFVMAFVFLGCVYCIRLKCWNAPRRRPNRPDPTDGA